MNLRERVIELSARITTLRSEILELEEKRTKLATMETELDSLLRQPATSHAAANGNGGGTIDDRVLRLLKESPSAKFTAAKVHERLNDVNVDSLRAALSR